MTPEGTILWAAWMSGGMLAITLFGMAICGLATLTAKVVR